MKRISLRYLVLLLLLCSVISALVACGGCKQHKDADRDGKCDVCSAAVEPCATHTDADKDGKCDICYASTTACKAHKSAERNGVCDLCGAELPAWVDYVAQTKLDMNSETLKEEVTVKYFIDGDTTHFHSGIGTNGIAKARYLGVNTPESTGKIEEWGKPASNFTKEKLSNAYSIIIESDGAEWEQDSNGRFLLWIWYQPTAGAEYRCLNLELLQEGLGRGASSSEGRYGSACVSAMAQAKNYSLYIFSGDKDVTFPYDEAVEVSLKELRTNITEYEGLNVVIEGTVVHNSDWTVYVEDYDAVTDRSYGIQVFYGYISGLNTKLAQGNRVRITGTVQEFFGTYQISNLTYKPLRPEDPANTVVLSEGNTPLFTEIDPADYVSKVTVPVTKVDESGESYEENVTFDSAALLVSSSVSMKNLNVTRVYTTTNTESDDYGAMTLTCKAADGTEISVRTAVLKDEQGQLITKGYFENQTIDVRGIVEFYQPDGGTGTYQIKVYTVEDFVIH